MKPCQTTWLLKKKMEAILLQLEKMDIRVIEEKSKDIIKENRKSGSKADTDLSGEDDNESTESSDDSDVLALDDDLTGTATKKKTASVASSDFGTVTDPVKMYLREMGLVTLLSREGEIEIAKKIEIGELDVLRSMLETVLTVNKIIELAKLVEMNKLRPKSVLRDIDESNEITDDRINLKNFLEAITEIDKINRINQDLFFAFTNGEISRTIYDKKRKANIIQIYDLLKGWRLESNVLVLIGDMIYSQIAWYKSMDELFASFASLFSISVSGLTEKLQRQEWICGMGSFQEKI